MASKLGQTDDSQDMPARATVVEIARRLGVGQYASQLCPSCLGGDKKERSMSLDIGSNGIIKFYCHRASCNFKGSAFTNEGIHVKSDGAALVSARLNNPYTGGLYPVTEMDIEYFGERYNLPEHVVKHAIKRSDTRYALPIFRPNGTTRGHVLRQPWPFAPLDPDSNSVKALTYMDDSDEPVQSWYYSNSNVYAGGASAVVLVEDSLSAMRLASYMDDMEGAEVNYAVCALLGTGVNAPKVREIQQIADDCPVYIALDADATGQAFAMARKWGAGFRSLRVVVLDRDIKDMSNEQLGELPL